MKVVWPIPAKSTVLERLALMKRSDLYLDISGTDCSAGACCVTASARSERNTSVRTDFRLQYRHVYLRRLAEKLERREQELVFAENFLRISGY